MLVVKTALRNRLLCYESPAAVPNMPPPFCPLPLQILSPCLIHQLINNTPAFHSSLCYLILNSATFRGEFIILPCHHGANKNVKVVSKCSG